MASLSWKKALDGCRILHVAAEFQYLKLGHLEKVSGEGKESGGGGGEEGRGGRARNMD